MGKEPKEVTERKAMEKETAEKEAVQKEVAERLKKYIDDRMKKMGIESYRQLDSRSGVSNSEINAILDKKINNLLDIIEEGTATETIKNRLNENATEKSALELRLNNLSIGVPVFTENIIKQQIKLLHPNNKTAEEQRTVFRKLGLKIRVYPDNHDHPIKITYGEKIVCLKNVSSPRYHPLSKLFIKIFFSDLNL